MRGRLPLLFTLLGAACADPAADGKVGADAEDGASDGVDAAGDGDATDGADGVADGADGATDGADGATDGADGATDGADGASDGADGATDGTDGGPDTGAPPPCLEGLQISALPDPLSGAAELALADEGALVWPEAPALTAARALTLRLSNPCAERLRFLGLPGDWVSGAGFALGTLPPVLLEPGASATITLSWAPGEAGAAVGSFALPHDQPGSPFSLRLEATAGPPLRLLLVGDGERRSLSEDYGLSWPVDGFATTEAHTDALQRGVCWGPPGFLAVGGSSRRLSWLSPTGHAWTPVDDGVGWVGDCAFGEGIYVAAGGFGLLARSADGLSWERGGDPGGEHLRAVAYGDGVFVAVGASRRMVSDDGLAITHDLSFPGTDLNRITFGLTSGGSPTFVAAGASGWVATSTDGGQTWLDQVVGGGNAHQQVVFTGDEFVLANGAELWASPDGYAWSLRNASTVIPFVGLGGRLWGAGSAGLVGSSDGGFRWSTLRVVDAGPGYIDGVMEGSP
jgi:hypothetical protein